MKIAFKELVKAKMWMFSVLLHALVFSLFYFNFESKSSMETEDLAQKESKQELLLLSESEYRRLFGNNYEKDEGAPSGVSILRSEPGANFKSKQKTKRLPSLKLPVVGSSSWGASVDSSITQNSQAYQRGDNSQAQSPEYLLKKDTYKYATFFKRLESLVKPQWASRIDNIISSADSATFLKYYRTDAEIVISKNGIVENVHLLGPSGYELFDVAAQRAVMSVDRLSNLPSEFKGADSKYRIKYGFVVLFVNNGTLFDYVRDSRFSKNSDLSD